MYEDLTLEIDGMHCDACIRRVTAALQRVEGVKLDGVQIGSAKLMFDPDETSPKQIEDAVDRIGFKATVRR